jgi:ubiquinone/menaquinone biosynthesis C-methylase UbiE
MDYYDSIASGYDELHGEEQLKKLRIIEQTIQQNPLLKNFMHHEYRLLDVGCGTGISTRYFDVKEHTGIDPSKELIKIAKEKDPEGTYTVMAAEHFSFQEKFDIVISLTAIQNFDNIEQGLSHTHKAGKRFVLSFLKKSEKHDMIDQLIKKIFHVITILEEEKDMIYFCT